MIVNYFNVQRIAVFPAKADSPLIVDPYTVLSLAVAFQGFKTVSGRNSKILQLDCTVQIKQLRNMGSDLFNDLISQKLMQ